MNDIFYRMGGDDLEFATLLFNYVKEHPEDKCGKVIRDEQGKVTNGSINPEKYEKICNEALKNHPDRDRLLEKYSIDELVKSARHRMLAFVSENC